jgi:acyl transferase domain-containing protein
MPFLANGLLPEAFETTNGSLSLEAAEDKLEPVAIIGFSLKFPQDATNPEAFWKMLVEARSAMTEIPKDRFNIDAYYHPDSEKPGTV